MGFNDPPPQSPLNHRRLDAFIRAASHVSEQGCLVFGYHYFLCFCNFFGYIRISQPMKYDPDAVL